MSVGLLEALFGAIGESDNEIGGIRLTRTTAATSFIGQTTLAVENMLDWPAAGTVLIDGVAYTYGSRTDTLLIDLAHEYAGAVVAGTARDHAVASVVADVSRAVSGIDLARRAMLVDFADGEDLNALARNLGVMRYPFLNSDDQFREIVKAIAYTPRGTTYSLELALDALVGPGNYEIIEDPVYSPCTVFVRLLNALAISDVAIGKYYISGVENRLSLSQSTVDLGTEPLRVGGVTLAPEGFVTECRNQRPTAHIIPEYEGDPGTTLWAYSGVSETADVVVSPNYCIMQASTGFGLMLYSHTPRITSQSSWYVEWLIAIQSLPVAAGTTGQYVSLFVDDGASFLGFGAFYISPGIYVVVMIDAGGAQVGTGYAGPFVFGDWHSFALKHGPGKPAELWVDGVLAISLDPSSFPTGSGVNLSFGNFVVGAGTPIIRMKHVTWAATDPSEYWHLPIAGQTAVAQPTRFAAISPATPFVAGDVGKAFQIEGGTSINPQGGSIKGRYIVDAVISTSVISVRGAAGSTGVVDSTNPTRVVVEGDQTFRYPEDLGKTITIAGSTLGNDGTYVITKLIELGTLVDFASYQTPGVTGWTSICECASAAFTSETDLDWSILPVFTNDLPAIAGLSDKGTVAGSTATLARDLPGATLVVAVRASRVVTGQLLRDAMVQNYKTNDSPLRYLYYPIYLSDPMGFIRQYLNQLTAAGVIPEFIAE